MTQHVNLLNPQFKIRDAELEYDDCMWASDVTVFKANPDGTKGEYLRTEPPTFFSQDNTKREHTSWTNL